MPTLKKTTTVILNPIITLLIVIVAPIYLLIGLSFIIIPVAPFSGLITIPGFALLTFIYKIIINFQRKINKGVSNNNLLKNMLLGYMLYIFLGYITFGYWAPEFGTALQNAMGEKNYHNMITFFDR
jgi:hypothetical protein